MLSSMSAYVAACAALQGLAHLRALTLVRPQQYLPSMHLAYLLNCIPSKVEVRPRHSLANTFCSLESPG
jgi:hypothetical protein